jgi:hypothetical protein
MTTYPGMLTKPEAARLNSMGMSFIIRNALDVSLEPFETLPIRLTEWLLENESNAAATEVTYWHRINEIWRRVVSRAIRDDNLRLVGHFKASMYKWYGIKL